MLLPCEDSVLVCWYLATYNSHQQAAQTNKQTNKQISWPGSTINYLPSLSTSCQNMVSRRERIMEKTRKFQIVYAGLTNLCQHSTTDLVRGIMSNEREQSAMSKVRPFKHPKTTSVLFVIQFITNEQVKLVSFTWEGSISRILILAVPLIENRL